MLVFWTRADAPVPCPDVSLVPSRAWSTRTGPGDPAARPSLLGLSLRVCNPKHALDQVRGRLVLCLSDLIFIIRYGGRGHCRFGTFSRFSRAVPPKVLVSRRAT